MEYNFVTNSKISLEFKKTPYYKVNLGYTSTEESPSSNRILSKKDSFAFRYNKRFSSTIMLNGNIGDINIYTDYGLRTDTILIYVGEEEFIFPFDFIKCNKVGISVYLGSMLKEIEEKLALVNVNVNNQNIDSSVETKIGDPRKLINSPGQVRWEDIKVYKDQMNMQK